MSTNGSRLPVQGEDVARLRSLVGELMATSGEWGFAMGRYMTDDDRHTPTSAALFAVVTDLRTAAEKAQAVICAAEGGAG